MLASQGVLPSPHFKQRGSLWPFMCSCSCSWSASSSLWRGSGVLTGSIFGLPPHEEQPSSTLHRLLKPRSPDDCPACRLASTHAAGGGPAPVRPLARGQKPPSRTQAREHRGLCLSQPAMPVLRDHRCPSPCAGWRWQARPWRTHPDVSRPCLPHYVQCPAPHAFVSFENPFPLRRHGALRAGRRVGSLGCRACLRLSTSHHHHLAVPSSPCTHKPCTSDPFAISTSRTSNWTAAAHPAPLRHRGALAG
jgi:hypothetical protein